METPPIQHTMGRALEKAPLFSQRTILIAGILFASFALIEWVTMTNNPIYPHPQAQPAAAAAVVVPDAFAGIELEAKGAIVIDLTTNTALFERSADAELALASMTKVPLAFVVSQALPLDTNITIPRDTSAPGSAERLAQGDIWKLKDVITFTLVASSNTGAEILAESADEVIRAHYPQAPEGKATIWRMNNLSRELGLKSFYFLNPSGLDQTLQQAGAYGSPRDVAKLFAYIASTSPEVFAGTTKDGLLLTSVNGAKTKAYNTDEALGSISGLIMGKTGYTDIAGGNLAIVFDVGPAHPVVAVVMGSSQKGRFEDMKKLVAATQKQIAAGK